MAFGKMRSFINIVSNVPVRDSAGFVANGEEVLASVRAYKEERHGNETWRNRAAFSTATALFRFRRIPGLVVDTTMFITCGDEQYNILSVEDVRGKNMYVECLADLVEGSVR